MDKYQLKYDMDDQEFMHILIDLKEDIRIDFDCSILQSIAFDRGDDFDYQSGRIINLKTKTLPCIIHGNGRTDMSKIYNLI
jgi:hypothetical protein